MRCHSQQPKAAWQPQEAMEMIFSYEIAAALDTSQ